MIYTRARPVMKLYIPIAANTKPHYSNKQRPWGSLRIGSSPHGCLTVPHELLQVSNAGKT